MYEGIKGKMKSDAEVLCEFMEKQPVNPPYSHQSVIPWGEHSPLRWWRPEVGPELHGHWEPRYSITLNECYEIEARLTEMQFWQYAHGLLPSCTSANSEAGLIALIHATAEQKIAALAAVIRASANFSC